MTHDQKAGMLTTQSKPGLTLSTGPVPVRAVLYVCPYTQRLLSVREATARKDTDGHGFNGGWSRPGLETPH
ncbi:hypothetical protein CFIMG_000351RAa [Ceratocystis fimbriata CBS 114723]|uniref:Uncharacterized protein n=1 Tax=Ceratocystis fimbriata CBS 114723 TaxID=1035309 RepID=A0A2C5XIM7_9PEZI|nr:hypothetical protein CFIMG_000351RAa [Ceratocystis fimbriata CBS 114723]